MPLITVSTGFVNGESEAARATGRVYVYEVSEVVGLEGLEGRASYKVKQVFSSADLQDIKAPVTAICQLEGYMLVAQVALCGGERVCVCVWGEGGVSVRSGSSRAACWWHR